MGLPRKNKLMLLFLAPSNLLLRRLKRFRTGKPLPSIRLDDDDIADITGVCRETPKNWASGGTIRRSKAMNVFSQVRDFLARAHAARTQPVPPAEEREYHDLLVTLDRFDAQFKESGAGVRVYEIARTLGMPADECKQTIDTAIYERTPLLSGIWYPARKDIPGPRDFADEDLKRYEGVYLMWVRRGEGWLQALLCVRYLQQQNIRKGELRFIRCKLNFPNLRSDQPPWHDYDGFLAVRPNGLYWTFEKRLSDRQDYFHLITNVAGPRGTSLSLHGRYLTTGQDDRQSVVADDVYLDHMFCEREDPYHQRYRALRVTAAKLISDPEELRKVEQRWQSLQTPSAPPTARAA